MKDSDVSSAHGSSFNRSNTTTGAGLANKIGQTMTRIISNMQPDEDI